jgi:hypothetical protein
VVVGVLLVVGAMLSMFCTRRPIGSANAMATSAG